MICSSFFLLHCLKISLRRAFPIFEHKESFFQPVPEQQRGIHCRYGMPGIIAEAHIDAGRNYIAMVRGRKRYILSPPSECANLGILPTGPSARHSYYDWSAPPDIEKMRNATGIEVILEAGDALYLPAMWFHFIVSLSVNIQCNSRSGTPPHGLAEMAECGISISGSESVGEFTSYAPPLRHLLAIARGDFDFASASVVPGRRSLAVAEALQLARSVGEIEAGHRRTYLMRTTEEQRGIRPIARNKSSPAAATVPHASLVAKPVIPESPRPEKAGSTSIEPLGVEVILKTKDSAAHSGKRQPSRVVLPKQRDKKRVRGDSSKNPHAPVPPMQMQVQELKGSDSDFTSSMSVVQVGAFLAALTLAAVFGGRAILRNRNSAAASLSQLAGRIQVD